METPNLQQIIAAWPNISGFLYVPHTEEDYHEIVSFLDSLIDEVGENESHPLASLMEVIGVLIEKYEDEHVPEITDISSPKD